MTIIGSLKSLIYRSVEHVSRHAAVAVQDDRSINLVLQAALREPNLLSTVRYPIAYVNFLRSCIECLPHVVTEIKTETQAPSKRAERRFAMLLDRLRTGLPAMEFSVARDIALIADQNRSLCEPLEFGNWAGDTGLHFEVSSSLGAKGRILFNIVRLMRSEHCLELGTAYGMSALFILAALKAFARDGRLTTIEGAEPQFSLGSSMLKERYGGMVSCRFGTTDSELPQLAACPRQVDFMFHDCGHSREDYVNDFNQTIRILAPGAVVLFDDIRWEEQMFSAQKAHTYEGWSEVVANPSVARAVEIDDVLGLLLMR